MGSAETAVAGDSRHDDLWERLLQYIDDGAVIPVVGQELLTIDVGGAAVPLYDELAQQLAARLKVALPSSGPRSPLNWVTSRFLEGGGEPERIYSELQRIVRNIGPMAPSSPLLKLAAMLPFKLFVSTTMDSMLGQAINSERFQGREATEVIPYSPGNPLDLPKDADESGRTFVYQLLGRVSSMQDYVVTEEDALEFLHHLLFSARPTRLFAHIQKRHLLILGCSFPSWMVRFFLRASRENRLLLARGKMDIVVDSGTREDLALVSFLQCHKTRTEVFDTGTAAEFVDKLYAKWTARLPAPARWRRCTRIPAALCQAGAVFLSYASEDRAVVEQIRDSLEESGMDVWFDRHDPRPGRRFRAAHPVQHRGGVALRARSLQLVPEAEPPVPPARMGLCDEGGAQGARVPAFHRPGRDRRPAADPPDLPDAFGAVHAARLENGVLPPKTIASILDRLHGVPETQGRPVSETPTQAEAARDTGVVDRDNPWPGLAAFRESDSAFFHGRDDAIRALTELVTRARLSVLYGVSGLGKTSLLQAGLFPRARTLDLFPLRIRLGLTQSSEPPAEQVHAALTREAAERRIKAPAREGRRETLWEFFYRKDALWWNDRHHIVTPLLVFDQFEEIFTIGRRSAETTRAVEQFLGELRAIILGAPPEVVKARCDADPDQALRYSLSRCPVRVLFSFREDYLAEFLELRDAFPAIGDQNLRLLRMSTDDALAVIRKAGGHLVEDARWRGESSRSSPRPGPTRARTQSDLVVRPCAAERLLPRTEQRAARQTTGRDHERSPPGQAGEDSRESSTRSFAGLDPRVQVFVEDDVARPTRRSATPSPNRSRCGARASRPRPSRA